MIGVLQPRKWENCMTLDKQSWGYRRNANFIDYLSPEELIASIVKTVACGGCEHDVIEEAKLTFKCPWLLPN